MPGSAVGDFIGRLLGGTETPLGVGLLGEIGSNVGKSISGAKHDAETGSALNTVGDILGIPAAIVTPLLGAVGNSIRPDGRISITQLLDLGGVRTKRMKAEEAQAKADEAKQKFEEANMATRVGELSSDQQQAILDYLGTQPAEPQTISIPNPGEDSQVITGAPLGITPASIQARKQKEDEARGALMNQGIDPNLLTNLKPKTVEEISAGLAKSQGQFEQQKQLLALKAAMPKPARRAAGAAGAFEDYKALLDAPERVSQDELAAARNRAINAGGKRVVMENPDGSRFIGTLGDYDKVRSRQLNTDIDNLATTNLLIDNALSIITPETVGVAGALRRARQDAIASIQGAGALFSSLDASAADIYKDIDPETGKEFRAYLGKTIPGSPTYDPRLPAIDSIMTSLVSQQAKAYESGGKLSDQDFLRALKAIGSPQDSFEKLTSNLRTAKRLNVGLTQLKQNQLRRVEASKSDDPMLGITRRMEYLRGYQTVDALTPDDMEQLLLDPSTPEAYRKELRDWSKEHELVGPPAPQR